MGHFIDRRQAGRILASALSARYAGRNDLVVLALPRGGVPVAWEVARRLRAPLDVFVVRKLGLPGHEEVAMGAVAPGDVCVLNEGLIHYLHIPDEVLEQVRERESEELARRERAYRGARPPIEVRGKTVILVDDGLATGSSMAAAVRALRSLAPDRIVVAVPIAAPQSCEEIGALADDIVCAATPEPFIAVGAWYTDFSQTTDEEVYDLLQSAAFEAPPTEVRAPETPAPRPHAS